MDGRDAYPAEMPNRPSRPIPALDDDTVERLLAGRLDPDDAPPSYAEVARLLRAAAAPPCPDELAGQEATLAAFRSARPNPAAARRRPGGVAQARGRLVAVALAGVLVAGGAAAAGAAAGGLWTTDGTPSSGPLRSPTGGPGAAGSGSSVSGTGGPGMGRDRAVARHGGGVTSRGGGTARGARPARSGRAETPERKPPKANGPKAKEPKAKGPKAESDKGGNRQLAPGSSRRTARR